MTRTAKIFSLPFILMALCIASVIIPSHTLAQTSVSQGIRGTFTDWFFSPPSTVSGFNDLEWDVTVNKDTFPAYYFYSTQFQISSGGGYFGFMSMGNSYKIAIFKMWPMQDGILAESSTPGATVHNGIIGCPSTNPGCGEPDYSSIELIYNWQAGRKYNLKIEKDATDATNVWWKASVTDTVTGITTTVGRMKTPSTYLEIPKSGLLVSFLENIEVSRDTILCADIVKADVSYTNVTANNGAYHISSLNNHLGGGPSTLCPGSYELYLTDGARQIIGAPDLTAGATTITPSSSVVGQNVSFSGTVSNIGADGMATSFSSIFQMLKVDPTSTSQVPINVNGTTVNVDRLSLIRMAANPLISSLAAGATSPTISSSYTFTSSGTYYVDLCANRDTAWNSTNWIDESDTTNNCGAWTLVTVSAAPVAPTVTLSASPTTGASPLDSTLTWTVSGGATSCTAGNGWSGAKAFTDGSHTQTISGITTTTTYTIYCTNAGGNSSTASATVTPTAPVVSGSLSVSSPSCTIASGASTCTVIASWTTLYATNPLLVDGNTNATLSTGSYSTGLTVWVAYPQTVFNLKNGSTLLDTKTVTSSCASGSSWDGSSCVATPTGTWTAPTCPTACGTAASNPSYSCVGGNGLCAVNTPATLACPAVVCSCTNGAIGDTTTGCNQCPSPQIYDGASASCVTPPTPLGITVAPTSYFVTLPNSTISATYTLTNGTAANTTCRLLNNAGTPLTAYASCSGSMSVTAPTTVGGGTYGYFIQANKGSTGETVKSNPFSVTVIPATVQCADGLFYDVNTSSCIACSNGGCTGKGGSSSNPAGSLVCGTGSCSNGADNYPDCTLCTSPETMVNGVCTPPTTCANGTKDTTCPPTSPILSALWQGSTYLGPSAAAYNANGYDVLANGSSPSGANLHYLFEWSTDNATWTGAEYSSIPVNTGGWTGSGGWAGVTHYKNAGPGTYYVRAWTVDSYGNHSVAPSAPMTITLSTSACPNGATNPPTCNTCAPSQVMSGGTCALCNGGCSGGSCNNGATNPPTCTTFSPTCSVLSVSPTDITIGGTVALTWSCQHASSCTAVTNTDGFSTGGQTSGTDSSVKPSATSGQVTYALTCDNSIPFNFPPVTVHPPTADITAIPSRVNPTVLNNTTVTWSSGGGVTQCAVTRIPSAAGWPHTELNSASLDPAGIHDSVTQQTTYTINCQNDAGFSATDSTIVNVQATFKEF